MLAGRQLLPLNLERQVTRCVEAEGAAVPPRRSKRVIAQSDPYGRDRLVVGWLLAWRHRGADPSPEGLGGREQSSSAAEAPLNNVYGGDATNAGCDAGRVATLAPDS